MKYTKTELIQAENSTIAFSDTLRFPDELFKKSDRIRRLLDVSVSGSLHYAMQDDLVYADLKISGEMVVPCAITLEDVVVPFQTESTELFSFEERENEDVHETKGDCVELVPVILQLIHMEAPLKVVKKDCQEYPKGDGWEVIREESYRHSKQNEIDPRLAKLKEFKLKD